MHTNNTHNALNYLKSILTWGLPGLYVLVALYVLTYLLTGIRMY